MCKDNEIEDLASKLILKGFRMKETEIRKNLCETNREFIEEMRRMLE